MKRYKSHLARYIKDDMHFRASHSRVNANKVFLETFDGTSQTCHPASIFEELIKNSSYSHLSFVWVFIGEKPLGYIWDKYKKNNRVKWVRHKSIAYYVNISSSKYLINNSTFPAEFSKKSEQIYINTWHGIPLKKMGRDIPLGVPATRNVIRNLISVDYIVSPNNFVTNKLWKYAFKLENIYTGRILEVGSPRVDIQFGQRDETRLKARRALGIKESDHRKIVLYAPTWNGTTPATIEDSSQQLSRDTEGLSRFLEKSEYLVVLKAHQLSLRRLTLESLPGILVAPNDLPTNMLLTCIDHLVTDQSSIAFDYLIENRPIHFYVDQDANQDESRGLYFDRKELPGSNDPDMESVATSIMEDELSLSLGRQDRYSKVRSEWRERYCSLEDGGATRRLIECIFGESVGMVGTSLEQPQKQRVLIHVGSLIANGITTAAINFANELDKLGYDVSIFYPYSRDSYQQSKTSEFNPNIRHFPRVGNIAVPINGRKAYRRFLNQGGKFSPGVNLKKIRQIFEKEWVRCFGHAQFDSVIAFDGWRICLGGTPIPRTRYAISA